MERRLSKFKTTGPVTSSDGSWRLNIGNSPERLVRTTYYLYKSAMILKTADKFLQVVPSQRLLALTTDNALRGCYGRHD